MKRILILAILALFLINSCAKEERLPFLIPGDAFFVTVVNPGKLYKKTGIGDFKESVFYQAIKKEMMKEDEGGKFLRYFEDFVENPQFTGIDFSKDMYFYAAENGFGLMAGLADSEKFGELFKGQDIQEIAGHSVVEISNGKALLAWNSQKAVMFGDMESPEDIEEYLNIEIENSLANNENFVRFLAEAKDISAWIDFEGASSSSFFDGGSEDDYTYDRPTTSPGIGGEEEYENEAEEDYDVEDLEYYDDEGIAGKAYEEDESKDREVYEYLPYMAFHTEFQKGAIKFSADFTLNEEFKKEIKLDKYAGPGISKNLLNLLPASDTYAALGFSLNPGILREILGEDEIDELNEGLSKLNLTADELIDGLTGDLIIAFNGMEITRKEGAAEDFGQPSDKKDYGTEYGEAPDSDPDDFDYNPYITALLGLKDKSLFQKMIPMFNDLGLNKEKSFYVGEVEDIPIFTGLLDNAFIISSFDKLQEIDPEKGYGNQGLANSRHAGQLENARFFFFVNLNKDNYSQEILDLLENHAGKEAMEVFDKMDYWSLGVYNESLSMTIGFKNKKDGGLKIMIEMIEDGIKQFI